MPDPILHLTITKGPRKGESLQCQPGTLTRIGRVIKGNAFAVRDKGASQSHLSFEFLPSSSRWAVSDLGSSNGTILNDASVPVGAAVPVADGDEIKIGESTIISVKIVEAEVVVEGHRRPLTRAGAKNELSLRGRKPRGNAKKDEMMEFEEEEEMEWLPLKSGRPLRGRKPKVDSSSNVGKMAEVIEEEEKNEKIGIDLVEEEEVIEEEKKKEKVVNDFVEKEELQKGKKLSGRKPKATCSLMNGKEDEKVMDDAEKEKIVQDSELEEEPRKVRQPRGTKPKKALGCLDRVLKEKDGEKEKVLDDGEREKIVEDSEVDENEEQPRKGRQLRARKRKEMPKSANAKEKEKISHDSEVGEEEQPRKEKFVRGRKPKVVPKLANGLAEEKNAEKGKASDDCEGGDDVEEEGKMGVEDGEAEVKGVAENSEEVGDDWVNMTLGEWFDRMEKFLPQVINDMAEEIIAELREKARQFDEYVANSADVA